MEDDSETKKTKGVKRCAIKRRLMFENYKDSLFNNKTIMWSQLRFKSNRHNLYTEEVNKVAPNSNDDKRLQTFDRVTTYLHGTNAFKVCEIEVLSKIRDSGDSGSGKTNVLLNLLENKPDIDKIYLYAKDPYECKYQYLINKRDGVGINHFKNSKAFIEYSNDMHDVYKNINYYNPDKENKILIVFDDMIAQ